MRAATDAATEPWAFMPCRRRLRENEPRPTLADRCVQLALQLALQLARSNSGPLAASARRLALAPAGKQAPALLKNAQPPVNYEKAPGIKP